MNTATAAPASAAAREGTKAQGAEQIPLGAIALSKSNPRVICDKAALDELTESVKAKGVLQPIIVRPVNGSGYEIVAGERRYRAAATAKLASIPAIVRELSDADVEEIQLIENLQRADLHPLDEAVAFDKLRRDGKVSIEHIGAQVHKSRAYVAQRLKLCALTETGRNAFKAGKLNIGVAFLLARISDTERKRKAEGAVRAALFAAIVEKFDGELKPPLMRLIFKKLFHTVGSDTTKRLRARWDPEVKANDYTWPNSYAKKIDKLADVDVRKQLLQTAIAGELYVPGYSTLAQSDVLKDVAAHLRIDADAIRKTILAGVKPAKKPTPAKKPAAVKKPSKPRTKRAR